MYLNICGGDFVIDYGNVRSTVKPEPIQFDEKSVWVNKNIKVVEEEEFSGWEYNMVQYTKDEYIRMLDTQLTDTQLALVEIYELMEG